MAMTACCDQAQADIGEEAGKSEQKTSFLSLSWRRQRRQREVEPRAQRKVEEKFDVNMVVVLNVVLDVFFSAWYFRVSCFQFFVVARMRTLVCRSLCTSTLQMY